jgi:putative oxidoreductase
LKIARSPPGLIKISFPANHGHYFPGALPLLLFQKINRYPDKMENIIQYHETAAVLIARIFLGLLFLFQGYDAIFRVKMKNVVSTMKMSFSGKGVPRVLVAGASWFTSYVQFLGGMLLLLGLLKYATLYILGIDLLIASIGFGIATPVWDTRHVFPRMILVVLLLLLPPAMDHWTLDNLLFHH